MSGFIFLVANPGSNDLPPMPHTLFTTALGTCGIAWNETGLTAFRLPEPDDSLGAGAFSKNPAEAEASEPPAWVAELIGRVQKHLRGELQNFAGARFDFTSVSAFQRAVYESALTV